MSASTPCFSTGEMLTNQHAFTMPTAENEVGDVIKGVKPSLKDTKRFWTKVLCGDDLDGCWIWRGSKKGTGYGEMRLPYKRVLVHRFSFLIHNGFLDESLLICHHCDTPLCVNPRHLFMGTKADNNTDKANKGRVVAKSGDEHHFRLHPEKIPRGERHGRAQISEAQARNILLRHSLGEDNTSIANSIGVSRHLVCCCTSRKTWRHIEI